PRAIYSIRLTAPPSSSGSEVLVIEAATSRWLKQIPFVEDTGRSVAADVFRTLEEGRVILQPYRPANQSVDSFPLPLVDGTIRKVATISNPDQSGRAAANRPAKAGPAITDGR